MAKPYVVTHCDTPPEMEQSFDFALKKGDVIHSRCTIISTIPDVMYPWDRFIISEIKRVEPRAVPVWIKEVWRTPAGTDHVFGYHGIYRYDRWEPRIDWAMRATEFRRDGLAEPNYEWMILKGEAEAEGFPGPFLFMDGEILTQVRKIVHSYQYEPESGAEAVARIQRAKAERQAKFQKWFDDEHDYRWSHDHHHDKSNAEKVSSSELARHDLGAHTPKPMVDLGA